MTSHIITPCLSQPEIETDEQLFDNWFDPIEAGLRDRACSISCKRCWKPSSNRRSRARGTPGAQQPTPRRRLIEFGHHPSLDLIASATATSSHPDPDVDPGPVAPKRQLIWSTIYPNRSALDGSHVTVQPGGQGELKVPLTVLQGRSASNLGHERVRRSGRSRGVLFAGLRAASKVHHGAGVAAGCHRVIRASGVVAKRRRSDRAEYFL